MQRHTRPAAAATGTPISIPTPVLGLRKAKKGAPPRLVTSQLKIQDIQMTGGQSTKSPHTLNQEKSVVSTVVDWDARGRGAPTYKRTSPRLLQWIERTCQKKSKDALIPSGKSKGRRRWLSSRQQHANSSRQCNHPGCTTWSRGSCSHCHRMEDRLLCLIRCPCPPCRHHLLTRRRSNFIIMELHQTFRLH